MDTTKLPRRDEFAEAVERVRAYLKERMPEASVDIVDPRGIVREVLGGDQVVSVDVPNVTLGDYVAAKGAMMDAATFFVDWDRLHGGEGESVSAPGRIIMQIAARLPS